MRKNIQGKIYDTETGHLFDSKSVGEFGDTSGYEEKLYATKRGLYFIYGIGGADSPYPKGEIKPLTKEQADEWRGISTADKGSSEKKSRSKKPAQSKEPKAKTPKKSVEKKPVKVTEPVESTEVSKSAAVEEDSAAAE